jgi:hypothetical protein
VKSDDVVGAAVGHDRIGSEGCLPAPNKPGELEWLLELWLFHFLSTQEKLRFRRSARLALTCWAGAAKQNPQIQWTGSGAHLIALASAYGG